MSETSSSDSATTITNHIGNGANYVPVSGSFFGSILKTLSENKTYIYIGIAVVLLGFVLYYFYSRTKKELGKKNTQPNSEIASQNKKTHLQPLEIPQQSPSSNEINLLHEQMLQHQLAEQKNKKQSSQKKLIHPNDTDTTTYTEDELARINSNENLNVSQHNLTKEELENIASQIEFMGSQIDQDD